ncbi:MAG TPA: DUF3224 domain-containing protein [Burkholderiaceae bacterium]|jgi:hypothetical protein|nr:DUF3224 domain-containing protein [Burkholderiaceae bacterium]
MQGTAHGEFHVTLTARPAGDSAAPLGRFLLAKRFEGGLEGTGVGEMLSAGDPSTGSGGYVALEWFEGRLADRTGRFALQHTGTLDRGQQALEIAVVPGSGSDGLAGIAGTFELRIVAGRHEYALHYTLPD